MSWTSRSTRSNSPAAHASNRQSARRARRAGSQFPSVDGRQQLGSRFHRRGCSRRSGSARRRSFFHAVEFAGLDRINERRGTGSGFRHGQILSFSYIELTKSPPGCLCCWVDACCRSRRHAQAPATTPPIPPLLPFQPCPNYPTCPTYPRNHTSPSTRWAICPLPGICFRSSTPCQPTSSATAWTRAASSTGEAATLGGPRELVDPDAVPPSTMWILPIRDGSGTPLLVPGVLEWQRVDVLTGAIPIDVNAAGFADVAHAAHGRRPGGRVGSKGSARRRRSFPSHS